MEAGTSVIVHVELSTFTARAKLTWGELGLGEDAPKKETASSGSKNLIDPVELQPFGRIKTAVGRLCTSYGVRMFSNAYYVSRGVLPELADKMTALRDEWWREVCDFIGNYPHLCDDWIARCKARGEKPRIIKAIQDAQPDAAKVESKFDFGWHVFDYAPDDSVGDGAKLTTSIPDKALEQILAQVGDVYRTNFINRKAGPKAHGGFEKVAGDCDKFVYVNPRIAYLQNILRELARINNPDITALVVKPLLDSNDPAVLIDDLQSQGVEAWILPVQEEPADDLIEEAEQVLAQPAPLDSSYVLDSLGLF